MSTPPLLVLLRRKTLSLLVWLVLTSCTSVSFAFVHYYKNALVHFCSHDDRRTSLSRNVLKHPHSLVEKDDHKDDSCDEYDINNHNNNNNDSTLSFVLVRPEEEESTCLPPGRLPELKLIFLISDATGVTARSTLLKSLAQFDTCTDDYSYSYNKPDSVDLVDKPSAAANSKNDNDDESLLFGGTCDVRTRTFTFIRSSQALTQILQTAHDKQACVMYTMADPQLRQVAYDFCTKHMIPQVDLMGPSLNVLASFLEKEPLGIPSRFSPRTKRKSHYLGDSYYKRIDAVEFALKADDGQSPWLLPEADIVLVGVSRSGKTPLSVVLSQTMSLKVANIPLVMEVPPPRQLLEQVDPRRIFCLTIAPGELRKIRTSRLERRGIKQIEDRYSSSSSSNNNNVTDQAVSLIPKSNYADRNYLLRDLANARQLSQQYNWTEIDVTGRAVEETATFIVELFNDRFVAATGAEGNHLEDDRPSSTTSSVSNQYIG
jgi:regulator of PEP synthase PpsR (kinase-PPPase family)